MLKSDLNFIIVTKHVFCLERLIKDFYRPPLSPPFPLYYTPSYYYERVLPHLDIYPSCTSRTIPVGLSSSEENIIRLLFPSKSDTDIVSLVKSVQYNRNECQSTANPSQSVLLRITAMFVPSIFERLMFRSVASLQNM